MSEVRFIGSRLAALMKERGFSDYTLAEKTGISHTMIYYLKKGQRKTASVDLVAKLADALTTSTQYFIDEDADDSPIQKKMSVLVAEIVNIAGGLSPTKQRQFRELGAALAKMEESTDLNTIYDELMELVTRLAKIKGGQKLLDDLLVHLQDLTSGSTSAPVKRQARRRGKGTDKSEPTDEKTESSE